MFFKKKDDKGKLPDLPPLPMEKFALRKPEMTQIKTGKPDLSRAIISSTDQEEEMPEETSQESSEEIVTDERQTLPIFPDSPITRGFSQSAIKEAVNDENELPNLPEIEEFPIQKVRQAKQKREVRELPESIEESEEFTAPEVKPARKVKSVREAPVIQELETPMDLPELGGTMNEEETTDVEEERPAFRTIEASESMYQPSAMSETPRRESRTAPMPSSIPASMSMPMSSSSSSIIQKPIERNKDIYVKLDKFRSGKKSLAEINSRLEDINSLLRKIRELKMREEQELVGWEAEIVAVKEKLKDVTQNIFEKIE